MGCGCGCVLGCVCVLTHVHTKDTQKQATEPLQGPEDVGQTLQKARAASASRPPSAAPGLDGCQAHSPGACCPAALRPGCRTRPSSGGKPAALPRFLRMQQVRGGFSRAGARLASSLLSGFQTTGPGVWAEQVRGAQCALSRAALSRGSCPAWSAPHLLHPTPRLTVNFTKDAAVESRWVFGLRGCGARFVLLQSREVALVTSAGHGYRCLSTESHGLKEKGKKRERGMETTRKRNVDLNLKSDCFGRKTRCLCLRLDAFLLR